MSIQMKRTGSLVILSAPSGGGKSTVLKAVRKHLDGLAYSISVTSRPPRGNERDGIDYFFVSVERFREMVQENAFYEWAEVHDNYYGTPKASVEQMLQQGLDITLDIDVQGAYAIKAVRADAVTIFLLPPSMEVLEKRLRGRETDGEEVIRVRLNNAAKEIAQCKSFDYLVVNEDLEHTVATVCSIIEAERQRSMRQRLVVDNEPAVEKFFS